MLEPTPPEFKIRASTADDAEGIALVHVQSWQSTYRGILPQEFLDQISFRERLELRRKLLREHTGAKLVAIQRETIVGFCNAGTNRDPDPRFEAELYGIYLLESVKRRGLGRELYCRVAAWARGNGMSSLIVWVLEDNHSARRFYEAMGGRPVSRRPVSIAGREYPEVSYGWEDLRA